MEELQLDSIIEANKWFVESEEETVLDLFKSQNTLTGLVQVILEEDMQFDEEFPKDLLYSLYGTILKAYTIQYGPKVKEVIEVDIDQAFEKQNSFAESLSKSLGFDEEEFDMEDEANSKKIMDKLSEIESKFNQKDDFDLDNGGLGDLADLLQEMSGGMKQSVLHFFLQEEIEGADLDDDTSGFLNQHLAIVIDALENMFERTTV